MTMKFKKINKQHQHSSLLPSVDFFFYKKGSQVLQVIPIVKAASVLTEVSFIKMNTSTDSF